MPDRILDLSEEPVRLSTRLDNLVLRRQDGNEIYLPYSEIAVVVASHPQITLTQGVLAGLARAGAIWISCDDKRLPIGMSMPLQAHSTQTERMAAQIAITKPTAKAAWQQVVRAKLRAQGDVLNALHGHDAGLPAMSARVRSGDPTNVEAQGARRYWAALFQDAEFHRDPMISGCNQILNYGYAVLRALTARAICAGGLHPSIGIHHHNRYSHFVLADDLMEPLRPIVDFAAFGIASAWGMDAGPDKFTKIALFEALGNKYRYGGEDRTLFDILTRVVSGLLEFFETRKTKIVYPDLHSTLAPGASQDAP